jgi:ribosome maturation factor RimP
VVSTKSIRELAEPALASAGLELWDVEIAGDVLRVMVDRPGGVDLDALSAASGVLSPLLDEHPEAAPNGRYQLEVSSPGVERTLRTPDQYRRYLGAELTVKTATAVAGARRHRGKLLQAGDDAITLEPDDLAGTRVELRYDQIDRARTVLVWGPGNARTAVGRPVGGRTRGSQPPAGQRVSARHAAKGRAKAYEPKDAGS